MSDKKDIFVEAAILAAKANIADNKVIEQPIETVVEKTQEEIAYDLVTTSESWDVLVSDMMGTHTDRFNKIMKEASDREFMRYYFKLLEYIKPKKVRDAEETEVNNNELHIHYHESSNDIKTEDNKTIDI